MNGQKGNVRIDIQADSKTGVIPEFVKPSVFYQKSLQHSRKWILDVWKFAKEDTNRVTFALKVGLACLLVSLLILCKEPYDKFGTNIIWAIITVAVMFEYTVGMYFNLFIR
jgi:Aluminium activated malate transporter